MPKLTKRRVESIKPAHRETVEWDSEVRGFGVRVYPSGRRTYFLKYRVGGGRSGTARKPMIGVHGAITVDEARAIARKWRADVDAGGDPASARKAAREAPTVAVLCDRYLEEHAHPHKKPRSAAEDERNIRNHVLPLLGRRKVAEVARADVTKALRAIRDGKTAKDEKTGKHGRSIVRGGPVAANRVLALLRTMFVLAERWSLRPEHSNPCRHAKKFPERPRERFLTCDEFARLGEALAEAEATCGETPAAVAAIRLLVFTGCRVSEILTLKWGYVDFERACLRLPDTKTGATVVHLAVPALGVLNAVPRVEGNPYVLAGAKPGCPLSGLKGPWGRIRKRVGIEDTRLHDLRHSFASTGAAAGLSLPMIGKLLGHRQAATTQRYAHLAADPVKQAVERVGGDLADALKGLRGGDVVPLHPRNHREQ